MTPSEIDLIRRCLAAFQRVEAEMREVRKRLLWLRPGTDAPRTSDRTAAVVVREDDQPRPLTSIRRPRRAVRQRSWGNSLSHTPKGPEAGERLRSLRQRLGMTQYALGAALHVSGALVGMIESGRAGISVAVHERLLALERSTAGSRVG